MVCFIVVFVRHGFARVYVPAWWEFSIFVVGMGYGFTGINVPSGWEFLIRVYC